MSKRFSARGRMAIYFCLGVLQRISGILLAPLYAHFFSTYEFGLYTLIISLEAVLVLIIDLGISTGILRSYYLLDRGIAEDLHAFAQVLSSIVSLVLSSFIFAIAYVVITKAGSDQILICYTALVIVSAFGQRALSLSLSVCRAKEDTISFMFISLASIFGVVILSCVSLYFLNMGLLGILSTRAIVFFGIALYLICFSLYHWPDSRNIPKLRAAIYSCFVRYSIPFLPHNLMKWAREQGTRVLLTGAMPLSLFGILGVAILPLRALSLTITSFDQIFDPFYFRAMTKGGVGNLNKIRAVFSLFIAFQAALCLVAMAIMPELMNLLFPPHYASASLYAPGLLAGQFMLVAQGFLLKRLTFFDRAASIPVITLVSSSLGAAATYGLTLAMGLTGATIGYLFTSSMAFFLAARACSKIGADRSSFGPQIASTSLIVITAGFLPLIFPSSWMIFSSVGLRLMSYGIAAIAILLPAMVNHRQEFKSFILNRA